MNARSPKDAKRPGSGMGGTLVADLSRELTNKDD
jgi:hypothetical protein